MRRHALAVGVALALLVIQSRAEFVNGSGVDNAGQLETVVARLDDVIAQQKREQQLICVLIGLVLVRLSSHGWRF